jgi:receptor protein-tyrosine kinase
MLDVLAAHFDVIIVDTPAAAESIDAQTVAMCAGGALIVTRKNASRVSQVLAVADSLVAARATVVGAVLNEF